MDEVVLNYYDSLIRKSDLKLLDRHNWLNDTLIAFYLQYLEHDLFVEHNDHVLYISPEVVQFIKASACKDDVALFVEALHLNEKSLVLLPVNDNSCISSPGGSHWSLLVYDGHKCKFQHYDSMSNSNKFSALKVAERIKPFVRASEKNSVKFEDMKCLQQSNTYDCGIHVIAMAETVLKSHILKDKSLINSLQHDVIESKRCELKSLIISLKNKIKC